jgi:hypothetical protein
VSEIAPVDGSSNATGRELKKAVDYHFTFIFTVFALLNISYKAIFEKYTINKLPMKERFGKNVL